MIALVLAATGQLEATSCAAPAADGWLTHPTAVQLMATAGAILVAAFVIWLNRWLQRRDERERLTLLFAHTLRQLHKRAEIATELESAVESDVPDRLADFMVQGPHRECAELSAMWPKATIFNEQTLYALEKVKIDAQVWAEITTNFERSDKGKLRRIVPAALSKNVIVDCEAALEALGRKLEKDDGQRVLS